MGEIRFWHREERRSSGLKLWSVTGDLSDGGQAFYRRLRLPPRRQAWLSASVTPLFQQFSWYRLEACCSREDVVRSQHLLPCGRVFPSVARLQDPFFLNFRVFLKHLSCL